MFIPDFFRGKPINFDDVVAKKVNVMGWIGEHGDWKKVCSFVVARTFGAYSCRCESLCLQCGPDLCIVG